MRETPRAMRPSRGIGTIIGNGWLRERPHDVGLAYEWQPRSKSFLRKCMLVPVSDDVRALQASHGAVVPRPAPRPEPEIVVHRRDPRKDVREIPAFVPGAWPHAQQLHAARLRDAHNQAIAAAATPNAAWWEDPVALGSLLIFAPPIGLAVVWSSKRYSSDARWALTVMTALTMCLLTAVVLVALMH